MSLFYRTPEEIEEFEEFMQTLSPCEMCKQILLLVGDTIASKICYTCYEALKDEWKDSTLDCSLDDLIIASVITNGLEK